MGALQSVGQGNKKTHEKKTKSGELQVGIDANQDNITGHFYVCNVTNLGVINVEFGSFV